MDAVAALAADQNVDIVYSVGSDIAMPTVARVSERLGLPMYHSVHTTDVLQRKDLLRTALANARLSPVEHRGLVDVSDVAGFRSFPAIIKPTDSQGQRGIAIVDTVESAIGAARTALASSSSGTAIIEEWLDGPEISVHVFVVNGEVRFFMPSDRYVWTGDLIGVAAGHAIPSRFLDESTTAEVRRLVAEFVVALDITTGPLYFQMKLTTSGPRIIEVASRLDGCHLWRLIQQHTGFNLMEACFDVLAGDPWIDPEPWEDENIDSLYFHLGPPDVPFHEADYPLPDDVAVTFSEIQVVEGVLPRDANGVVSRLGYYTTREPA